jgi:hypothetical protein
LGRGNFSTYSVDPDFVFFRRGGLPLRVWPRKGTLVA